MAALSASSQDASLLSEDVRRTACGGDVRGTRTHGLTMDRVKVQSVMSEDPQNEILQIKAQNGLHSTIDEFLAMTCW